MKPGAGGGLADARARLPGLPQGNGSADWLRWSGCG
eukprot:gene25609-32085_t